MPFLVIGLKIETWAFAPNMLGLRMICSPPLLHLKTPGNPNEFSPPPSAAVKSVKTLPGSGISPARNFVVSTRVLSLVRQISSYDLTFNDEDFSVELGRLLYILPEEMRRRVAEHPELQFLIEVVMDLGRKPLARFHSGYFVLSNQPITAEEIQRPTSHVGDFVVDNRAGISRTLHPYQCY